MHSGREIVGYLRQHFGDDAIDESAVADGLVAAIAADFDLGVDDDREDGTDGDNDDGDDDDTVAVPTEEDRFLDGVPPYPACCYPKRPAGLTIESAPNFAASLQGGRAVGRTDFVHWPSNFPNHCRLDLVHCCAVASPPHRPPG